ncbi:ABC transporter substrate-binding protein [Falsibacillus pallidus]|uniref:Putative spermidine/putrescine transport system substrate-binding protein n=1 Tax=Falsibacillus pallidus TaxID=493781 RepID=A0A370FZN0_9BACI|nr:ABC transporter substrate-binding protein [Falsibacillus pallidus]RDI36928.1 putative spermidine/putrescine transport system substrate-binding protein [Falsibacillus pallidus]
MKKQSLIKVLSIGVTSAFLMAGCSGNDEANGSKIDTSNLSLDKIEQKAKKEGEVHSVGMPDSWANWGQTWNDITGKYGIKHTDTDMSSAEELAKFETGNSDVGDVGVAFGPLAEEKGLTLPYKPTHWDDIPKWAKDDNGDWVVGYTGTLAFITDKNNVKNPPKSWKDLLNGDYKVDVGDVMKANQAQFAVLAAAYANGGDEKNIEPGIKFFEKLAKQGRLQTTDPSLTSLEKGENEVAIVWDFNALNYRDQIQKDRFDVVIPSDASVISGYANVINKKAKDPYSAMLTREYIMSDEGQANLARGYARPIRSDVKLPEDAKAKLLPDSMYKKAQPVKDMKAWDETTKALPQKWQEKVLVHVN